MLIAQEQGGPRKVATLATTNEAGSSTGGKGSSTEPTPSSAGKGLLTAMTKRECEYILNKLIDDANWGSLVKSTNEMFGQQRRSDNVERHWKTIVMRVLKAAYRDE
jgi:hypothetical protein